MLNAITQIGVRNGFRTSFKGNTGENTLIQPEKIDNKSSIETTNKVLLGLGATAAIVIGGLLVKKHIDSKAAEKVVKEINVQKVKEFSENNMIDVAKDWYKTGKLKTGDKVVCISSKNFINSAENLGEFQILKNMNLSDNSLILSVQKADGSVDGSLFKCFDPEKIVYEKLQNALNAGKVYTREVVIDSKNNNCIFIPIK